MRSRQWLLLGLGFVGCGGRAEIDEGQAPRGPDSVQPADEHDARFVGSWVVEDQKVPHDAYEGVLYGFLQDGTVVLERRSYPNAGRELVTNGSGISCAIGTSWKSDGPAVLVLAGECTDGASREIVVEFTNDPSSNAANSGTVTRYKSVGGESGWTDTTYAGWDFRKCVAPCRI